MSEKETTLNLRVNKQLKLKFKGYVAMNGETMSEALERMMKEYVEKNENKTE